MSDFVQIMKDWRRMCQFMDKEYGNSSCDNCPLGGCSAIYEMCDKENFANMEHDIAAWAADHPEPVYPTWSEFLYNLYPMMGPSTITDILEFHVPPALAEKLGIEPKENE